ncbi:MAG: hypothetical protein WB783_06945 [Arenicellales bacterium]
MRREHADSIVADLLERGRGKRAVITFDIALSVGAHCPLVWRIA